MWACVWVCVCGCGGIHVCVRGCGVGVRGMNVCVCVNVCVCACGVCGHGCLGYLLGSSPGGVICPGDGLGSFPMTARGEMPLPDLLLAAV